jgi:molybdopterin-guanine dinucleotide biosynthesis protein A
MIKGITGVVLAGGANKRFPTLKGFIKVGDSTIIEKNLGLLRDLFNKVFISTNMPETYFFTGAPLIGDVLPSKGPMSGIHSSLINAGGDDIFVIACDMPFVNADVVSFICGEHMRAPVPAAATVPVYNGKPQPLSGVYSRTILPYLEAGILNGKVSLRRFLTEIRTNLVSEPDMRAIDPDGRSFVNINTVEDYETVMRHV